MPIVEDYDAIAKRLRELRAVAPKSADEITELERWRDLARQTAREYVENRRRSIKAYIAGRR
jgi:DNA-binding ferritin-like protein